MQAGINDIRKNMAGVIVGKEKVTDYILTAMLASGHVLLEDVPGTGKTLIAKTLAKSVDAQFSRIQFTPDLVPSDVTGIHYYNQKAGEFVLRKGPVFANIVLADEINRATPRTQSSMLECMEERFMMKISMGYPDRDGELLMMNRFLSDNPAESIRPVCTKQDIIKMQDESQKVYIHPHLMEYIADIVRMTRELPEAAIGVSPRGTLTMLRAVRAYAYINSRDYVVPEDIRELAVPVLAHRIVLKSGAVMKDNRKAMVEAILDRCPLKTEDWNTQRD